MTEDAPEPLFLLSLPRSGSTLLQRILAAHEAVATVPEPWLLLPLLYALRVDGTVSEYGHRFGVLALEDLFERLPQGRDDYLEEVAKLARSLYGKASPPGTAFFLDKTPRYNLVCDDLVRMFPASPMVVLWRNPLAVVASCVDTWLDGRWMPSLFKVDLFEGLDRLLRCYTADPGRFVSLRYEDLVTDGGPQLERVFTTMGLPFELDLLVKFSGVELGGTLGDHTGVSRYSTLTTASVDRWKRVLASPVRKAWCRRYLRWIGDERLAVMGYSKAALLEELDAVPDQPARAAADAYWTGRGIMRDALEPRLFREKFSRLPAWHRISAYG